MHACMRACVGACERAGVRASEAARGVRKETTKHGASVTASRRRGQVDFSEMCEEEDSMFAHKESDPLVARRALVPPCV